ncbi:MULTISPECIES: serine O-acetyltransferase EpsC [Sphingomonas]|uniref:serine O-acetyltransferase n=1 Tax=Sphingomonas leidyi TaxID=68569 RepID=A0A7X5ZUL3_9SPHN|nr:MULTISPECIES: serine O-acetyltransferase EpsC [Sphingomonas]MBN8813428.1 serine acetyltransferase [Sphingomonas sp.]NIJ63538.1 serine O-acetyltransferase [Sphingomonas leidyi]OJY52930.1 MAG: serine acetyltransferase [Sphingomonas sp. 67-41]
MRSTSPGQPDPTLAAGIADAVAALNAVRSAWRARQPGRGSVTRFPSPAGLARAVEHLSAALFPARLGGFRDGPAGEDDFVAEQLHRALTLLREEVASELDYWQAESDQPFEPDQPDAIVRLFAATLAEIRALVDADVEAAFVGDPAARSTDEILISYPGALAILHHRIAHQLHTLGAVIVARVISELANARTGIDIHPGATIGPSFFIDHGTGVVIGETAIIGRGVRLYQHVTLGARSPLGLAPTGPRTRHARHPIVEDGVTIYAGATILGRVTIGRGSVIGGNVWLLDDVPPESVVAQPEAIRLGPAARDALSERLAEHGA